LKQAPKIWYEKLWADSIAKGFEISKSCPRVFKMQMKNLYLLIYVDDTLVIGPDEAEITQVKGILAELYEVKNIGVAKYFLGVEIHHADDGSMSLSQALYINKMCDKYKMSDAKPVKSPTDRWHLSKLRPGETSTAEESIDMTKVPYRELIGGLLFLSTRTRPDIAVAVGIVAGRVSDLRQVDWIAAKRILRRSVFFFLRR
jgi:hypothetical protein